MAEDKKWEVTQARIEQEVREWCDEFEKSKEYKKLPEEVGQWAYPVIHGFASLAEGERGKTIAEWDDETVAWVLLEGMPREFVVDREALGVTVEVMEAFIAYAVRTGMMDKKSKVLARIEEIRPLAKRRLLDPTLWQPHKAVILEALQEGIDLADRKGMERFYKKYQARRTGNYAETILAAQTPGRNDPCNCGSGKKYKKCCGRAH